MIAKAKSEDFAQILAIISENQSNQFAWNENNFKQEFLLNSTFTNSIDGEIVSFAVVADRGEVIELTVLGTKKSRQQQGRMKELIKWLINAYSQKSEIWLEVHELNTSAIKLYLSLGFKEVGRRPKYYQDTRSAIMLSFKMGS